MSVGYDKVSQRFVASQWYMIKVVRDFDRSVKIYWPALSTWLVFNTWKFCRLSVDWSVENTTLAVALSRKYCPCHGPIQKIWPLPWHYPENMTTAMALSRKYDPCRGPIQKIWPLPWPYPENMTPAVALSRKYDPCRGPIQNFIKCYSAYTYIYIYITKKRSINHLMLFFIRSVQGSPHLVKTEWHHFCFSWLKGSVKENLGYFWRAYRYSFPICIPSFHKTNCAAQWS
jgi:hypothetical protein